MIIHVVNKLLSKSDLFGKEKKANSNKVKLQPKLSFVNLHHSLRETLEEPLQSAWRMSRH